MAHSLSVLGVAAVALVVFQPPDDRQASPPQAAVRTGVLSDPVGDSRASAEVRTPPDLVMAELEVRDRALTITVSFAPRTLSPQTDVRVYLDTDEKPETGEPIYRGDRQPLGADYVITGVTPHSPSMAALQHYAAPGRSTFKGAIQVESPTVDQRRFVLPLSRLGNDDGRLKFKVECNHVLPASVVTTAAGERVTQRILLYLDLMPDTGSAAGVVR